ncbi:MAG: ABC transporter permease [Armatimonadetes bacterium]|nr:ABC transporter permease [Armatimonadota bacterium]
MLEDIREVWRYRELLRTMVRRDLQVRYKNSVAGFFWSLINPLATMVVLTVVFKYIMGNPIPNFSAYLLSAQLPYLFFQQSLMDASQSVNAGAQIMKKIYFPREIYPLSNIIANFVHLILALFVFFAYLIVIWLRHPAVFPIPWTVVLLPLLLFVNFCMVTGLGLLFSALNMFFDDVKYMLGIMLYLLFFMCPIVYPPEYIAYSAQIPEKWRPIIYNLYFSNPIAYLISAYRRILVKAPEYVLVGGVKHPPLELSVNKGLLCLAFSFFFLWFGYGVFNRYKWKFLEKP